MSFQSQSPVIKWCCLGLVVITVAACNAHAGKSSPTARVVVTDEEWSYPKSEATPAPTPTPVAAHKPPPRVREVPPPSRSAPKPAPDVREGGGDAQVSPIDPQRGEQTYYLAFNNFDGGAYDYIERRLMGADQYYRGIEQNRSTATAVYATYRTGLSTSEIRRVLNSIKDQSGIAYSISSNGHNFTITRRAVRR